jgi:hypothetical protein
MANSHTSSNIFVWSLKVLITNILLIWKHIRDCGAKNRGFFLNLVSSRRADLFSFYIVQLTIIRPLNFRSTTIYLYFECSSPRPGRLPSDGEHDSNCRQLLLLLAATTTTSTSRPPRRRGRQTRASMIHHFIIPFSPPIFPPDQEIFCSARLGQDPIVDALPRASSIIGAPSDLVGRWLDMMRCVIRPGHQLAFPFLLTGCLRWVLLCPIWFPPRLICVCGSVARPLSVHCVQPSR